MKRKQKENINNILQHNISYYNEIADSYDGIMKEDKSNEIIRQRVKEKMLEVLKSGNILDFGGGTGLDLEWLSAANYTIYFCEPSESMRQRAINLNDTLLHRSNIFFLDSEKTDFTKWKYTPPLNDQVDGILSNFGVLNYIPDLDELFKNLSGILKQDGHMIAIVLDLSFKKRLKWHRRNAIRSLLLHVPFVMYIPHKDKKQTVTVHTLAEIKNASQEYFDFVSAESFESLDFTLIHLTRK